MHGQKNIKLPASSRTKQRAAVWKDQLSLSYVLVYKPNWQQSNANGKKVFSITDCFYFFTEI